MNMLIDKDIWNE